MTATEILKNEHRVIEQVLFCLERLAADADAKDEIDIEAARQMIDFFRKFADGCHHAKEEKQLFPRLEAHGFQRQGGPTGVMMGEHEEGRRILAAMEQALTEPVDQADAAARFARDARAYIQLLRNHIAKEDHCLFAMADVALTPVEQQELVEEFETIEHDDVAPGDHEKFLRLANDLAARFGLASVSGVLAGTTCCHHGTHG
jgi:hemerythrin-like domain-containing protein